MTYMSTKHSGPPLTGLQRKPRPSFATSTLMLCHLILWDIAGIKPGANLPGLGNWDKSDLHPLANEQVIGD